VTTLDVSNIDDIKQLEARVQNPPAINYGAIILRELMALTYEIGMGYVYCLTIERHSGIAS
jgi:hypothetical protein